MKKYLILLLFLFVTFGFSQKKKKKNKAKMPAKTEIIKEKPPKVVSETLRHERIMDAPTEEYNSDNESKIFDEVEINPIPPNGVENFKRTMDLSGIISIAGMSGLFKVIAQTKNGLEMLYLQAERSWEIWNENY